MRILYLEDNDLIRSSVRRFLRRHSIDECTTARRSLDLLAERNYDVFISDWDVADGTSQEAIEYAASRGIPVIIMSGALECQLTAERLKLPLIQKGASAIQELVNKVSVHPEGVSHNE